MSDKKIMKTLNGYAVYDEEAHRRIDSLAGSAPGLVFDTVAAMEAYVAEHTAELKVGQNLYIREADVPDYWWDGTAVQELETKVDLSGYAKQEEVDSLSEAIADLELGGNAGTVSAIQSVLTDIVTFLKAVPFDDTVVSASDLDDIQSKIDALGSGGGTDEPEQPDEPDEPVETISATFSGGELVISGVTVNSATFSDGVLAVA